jgi:hypothetical protein
LALHALLAAQDWCRSVDNSCHRTEFTAKSKETKTFFAALRVGGLWVVWWVNHPPVFDAPPSLRVNRKNLHLVLKKR